jgi:hypothetical protein
MLPLFHFVKHSAKGVIHNQKIRINSMFVFTQKRNYRMIQKNCVFRITNASLEGTDCKSVPVGVKYGVRHMRLKKTNNIPI